MTTTVIQSTALYPREGVANINRRYNPLDPPLWVWPELEVGQELEVHDTQGWMWKVKVTELPEGSCPNGAKVQVLEGPTALPFPEIRIDSATGVSLVTLPNMSGHAHLRSWDKGDVVKEGNDYYKVTKVTLSPNGSRVTYTLAPSSPTAYLIRPGRIKYSSEHGAHQDLGSAILTRSGEWLHVTKLTRTTYSGALGRGYTYWGKGKYVSAEKAEKINEVHPRLLDAALSSNSGTRVNTIPHTAVQLVPKTKGSLARSGTRVAVEGNTIWHERVGDPDQCDSWYHYVVQFDDAKLAKRVKAYVKKQTKKAKQ